MKTKRLIVPILLAVFASQLLVLLAPSEAAAATVRGRWEAKDTILVGTDRYIDNKPDDPEMDYYKDGKDELTDCADVIRDFNAAKTEAKLYKGGSVTMPDCFSKPKITDTVKPIDNPENYNKVAIGAPDTGGEESDESCEEKSGVMGWMICPVILMTDSALNWVDTQILRLLEIDKNTYDNEGMRKAWATTRNFAYIILVPIMLVMVIGTALGFEFVSAYTVKRALPRLMAAAIFISLSYTICTFLIELADVVGRGVIGLMTAPFGEHVSTLSLADLFGGSIFTSIFALPLFTIGVAIMIWLFGGTLLLFAGVAFLVLMFRQMLIVALILVAPLAILAWIFPGNDKLWKAWWSLFSKLLIMFPLIMGLIAAGRIFAVIIHDGGAGALQGSILNPLMKLLAYMLPYAFIPFVFKFAGGVFATVSGVANDRSKGLFDRQRKSREAKLERTAQSNMFKNAPENSLRGRLNRAGFIAMNARQAGWRPGSMRANMAAYSSSHAFAEAQEAMQKNHALTSILEDDNLLEAGRGGVNAATVRQRLWDAGRRGDALEQGVAAVMKARGSMSNEAFDIAAVLGTAATSTGFSGGQGEMLAAVDQASGGNQVLFSKLLGAAKSGATRAGRLDLGGNSYGNSMALGNTIRNARTADERAAAIAAANSVAATQVVDQQGGGAILTAKNRALRNLVPGLQARIQAHAQAVRDAHATGDGRSVDLAEREFKQTLADTAGLLDAAGQVSPENSRLLADLVMNDQYVTAGGRQVRVSDAIESLRNDAEFGQKRREYRNAAIGQAAALQQAQMQPLAPPPVVGPPEG